ncbi:hypothetical protein QMZ05_28435 [Bradyrhizobium sp. INPA03-11B]|uniref:hypothetical protein n=1 Tax=Bradyrhizobium sp. INPA03-11B TaxID=418598 RepID=UPI00338F2647
MVEFKFRTATILVSPPGILGERTDIIDFSRFTPTSALGRISLTSAKITVNDLSLAWHS